MAICKTCGTKFHACSNCGLYGYEWEYCNHTCWYNSERYQKVKEMLSILDKTTLDYIVNEICEWEIETVGNAILEERSKE